MSLKLYYFPTPNGRKVSIALEEMGVDYDVVPINILLGEQSRPEFVEISPNGRIPALVDSGVAGEAVTVFESGAILQYLGRKTGLFYPAAEVERTRVDSWLFWQMAHLGPMTGQITWFRRAAAKPGRAPEETSLALHRYEKETRRLYSVLEKHLRNRTFIVGDYSIADMAVWPWVHQHHDYLGDLSQFPNISAWYQQIFHRPAVQQALLVGMEGLAAQ